MSQKTDLQQRWAVASYELQDAYTDFILSRQAMLCSPKTIRFYHFTAGRFVKYLEENGVTEPEGVSARYIRAYLALLASQNLSDSYINGHARAIKTLVRFWFKEKYINEVPSFDMPSIAQKRLLVLSALQVKKAISACTTDRDKAIIMLLVDTGLRRAEICALNWGDIDISSGIVRVAKGKGGKARSVVAGIKTRRALLAYRKTSTTKKICRSSKPKLANDWNRMVFALYYFELGNELNYKLLRMPFEELLRHYL
jgi:site-specific recombinase XerD